MTTHDYEAEAREFAARIPDPPEPPANVIRFPTPSERMRRESDRWLRRWTRPFDDNPPPSAA